MSGRKKFRCDCQCGGEDYWNKLQVVEVEQATDKTLRETRIKRFYVLPDCKEPFEEELAMMQLLEITIRRWAPKFWWQRMFVARRVLRLQHGIFVRNKGFDFARQHATRSMILFVAPAFLAKILHRKFAKDLNKEHAAITPTVVQAEATA